MARGAGMVAPPPSVAGDEVTHPSDCKEIYPYSSLQLDGIAGTRRAVCHENTSSAVLDDTK